jgi:phospholipid-binding lipoprotein MlaA
VPNSAAPSQVSDPFEPVNRLMWDFNYQILDSYIYRPVTETYVDWVPTVGRKAINNFVLNFEEPSTMVNNLIQLNFKSSVQAFFRFSVNSTFGIAGFIDVAEKLGVPRRRESFSNVLGHWFVPNGPYLMVPFLGPRSTRKLVGGFVDGLYFPFNYLTFEQELGLDVLDALDVRESLLGQEALLEQSLDPYLFVRDAYIQNEAFKVYGKESEDTSQPRQENKETEEFDINLDEFMDEID